MNKQLETQTKTLIKAFECGVDYGLLIAEEERDSEDFFDAAQCSAYSRKMSMPSIQAPRRMPRSENWRKAKRDGLIRFIELIKETAVERSETP